MPSGFFQRSHAPTSAQLAFILGLGTLLYALAAIFWLQQDANWDLRNYHWYNAYAFLNGRFGFDLLPAQTPTFYNPTLDVPFYWLATHLPPRGAVFLLALAQGLNFPLLFLLAGTALPEASVRLKLAVAAIGVCGGGTLAELGTTFYDNVTSLGFFGSALLALHAARSKAPARWHAWFLAGIPIGCAMGLKQPTIVFGVGLCGAALFLPFSWIGRLRIALLFGLGATLGLALCSGHWMWFLWHEFHNPLFPYFNNIFQAPDAASVSARDTKFIPESLWGKFLLPFHIMRSPQAVGEIDWQDYRIGLWWGGMLLLPFGAALSKCISHIKAARHPADGETKNCTGYLLAAGLFSYLCWLFLFCIYRYLLPLEMLAPLLIIIIVKRSIPALAFPRLRSLVVWLLLLLIAASIRPGDWQRIPWGKHFVDAQIPVIRNSSKTMLLMTGLSPDSYLIPSFPHDMPAIRIESNFSTPSDKDKGINRRFAARLAAHRAQGGSFLALFSARDTDATREALDPFGLALAPGAPQNCPVARHNLFAEDLYYLCPVIASKP